MADAALPLYSLLYYSQTHGIDSNQRLLGCTAQGKEVELSLVRDENEKFLPELIFPQFQAKIFSKNLDYEVSQEALTIFVHTVLVQKE